MSDPKLPLRTVHTLERAGSVLHAWTSGPEAGPWVAMTHGASMDHRMFDAQLAALTSAGYRVLTWDMRGHGLSKPIGRTPLSIRDLSDDLLALLEHLGARMPICLVGQSLGAYVVQDVVLTQPERVACLAVVGATCLTLPIAWWEAQALKTSAVWLRLWPDAHFRRLIARSTAVRPDVRAYALEANARISRQEFFHIWQAVAHALRPMPEYRIEHPLLLVHGDQDRAGTVAKSAPLWAARDPRCRYEIIPNAAHNANQDNPSAFNALLLEFLQQYYPAA